MKVNALPVNQSGRQIQCYGCQQWGHKKADCPNKGNNQKKVGNSLSHSLPPSLPSQEEAFKNRNKKPPQAKTQAKAPNVKINYIRVKTEGEEQAQIYAALDPSGRNRQFTVLEAEGKYEGNSLAFLIDSGSSHSFISPSTAARLGLKA